MAFFWGSYVEMFAVGTVEENLPISGVRELLRRIFLHFQASGCLYTNIHYLLRLWFSMA